MPSMRTQRFTWVGIARVGRLVSRVMMEDDDIKLNAVNAGPATTNCMAYQYKYDTIRCRDPNEAGWGALRADYVCDSTSIFLTKETVQAIIDGGTKKVVSSAPAKDSSQVVVMGVNADE
jgi:glyceraldehyde 3-phosphate dehydrogenase